MGYVYKAKDSDKGNRGRRLKMKFSMSKVLNATIPKEKRQYVSISGWIPIQNIWERRYKSIENASMLRILITPLNDDLGKVHGGEREKLER